MELTEKEIKELRLIVGRYIERGANRGTLYQGNLTFKELITLSNKLYSVELAPLKNIGNCS